VGWIGLCAPARTPAAILDKLNAEVAKMLASPPVKVRLEQLAFTPAGDSRSHFAAWIKSEIAKWSAIAKASGAKAD
jgi:tripartite-type tricarboxylate transporter receptor subunit TctC